MSVRAFPITRLPAALTLIAVASLALAQSSGGDYEVTGHTIDAGGGTSSAPTFELTGTIAQPDANDQQSSGGNFVLAGGMWASAREVVFFDGFEGGP